MILQLSPQRTPRTRKNEQYGSVKLLHCLTGILIGTMPVINIASGVPLVCLCVLGG